MTYLRKSLMIVATLAMAACSNADRFGNNSTDLNSANASSQDPRSPGYFQEAVGDRVVFEVDQASLTPQGIATLQGQAQWLLTNTDYNAVIEGHADEQGTREYNLALGARRSNAVHEYLVSQGVADNRLRVVSFGKERPLEICSEESCYAKNRRAVTVISVGAAS